MFRTTEAMVKLFVSFFYKHKKPKRKEAVVVSKVLMPRCCFYPFMTPLPT